MIYKFKLSVLLLLQYVHHLSLIWLRVRWKLGVHALTCSGIEILFINKLSKYNKRKLDNTKSFIHCYQLSQR